MSGAPRAAPDTNVVLSALLFAGGRLASLRTAWQQSRLMPLVARGSAAEPVRALGYPECRLAAEEPQELLADYLPYCVTVATPTRPPRTPACRDAADLPFLQLAITGKTACLVTGDRDLLVVTKARSCRIVDSRQTRALVGSE